MQSFALGIHAVFALLALAASLLQLAGNIIGWGFQFQNPLYVFALLSLTWYMGLYLAGAYHLPTLSLSSTTAPPTSAPSVQREHFILGSVTALLATPCTAPLLAPAIGYFFSRTWWELSLGINLVGAGIGIAVLGAGHVCTRAGYPQPACCRAPVHGCIPLNSCLHFHSCSSASGC